jgi:hypothetical protein
MVLDRSTRHRHQRRGTVLVLCLTIVVALSLMAFAFLRVTSLHATGGASEARMLLAREAARMGFAHATEQIIRDFSTPGAFSRMEDSSHAAFVAVKRPYESDYATDQSESPQLLNVNEIPAENNLLQSFGGPYNDWNSMAAGQHTSDGRGRFYEPGFQNRAVTGIDLTASQPTVPVPFGSPATVLPDRHDGIFYDVRLKRIPLSVPGDALLVRETARFRLRYAINVVDLDGELLLNGDPAVPCTDLQAAGPLATTADPAHHLTPAERILRWKHAVPQITLAGGRFAASGYGWGTGVAGGSRLEHLFMGRGATANFDRDPSRGYAPVSFPFMYRDKPSGFANGKVTAFQDPAVFALAPELFGDTPGGGVPIANTDTLMRGLVGPQFSFTNFDESVQGAAWEGGQARPGVLGRYTPFGRGLAQAATPGRWAGNVDTPWCVNLMTANSSIIYGMIAGFMPPGAIQVYYHNKPPAITPPPIIPNGDWRGMSYSAELLGTRDLFVKEFSPAFGPGYGDYQTPHRASPTVSIDYHSPVARTVAQRYPGVIGLNGADDTGMWCHDDLGKYLRATKRAFVSTASDDGRIDETGRPEVTRLTGRFKEGGYRPNPSQPRNEISWWFHHDTYLGTGSARMGGPPPSTPPPQPDPPIWVYTSAYRKDSLVRVVGPPDTYYRAKRDIPASPIVAPVPTTPLPADWDVVTLPPPETPAWDAAVVGAHPDSIWDAVGNAMSTAIAVARGQYLQYPNLNSKPGRYFNGTAWNTAWGPRVTSIKDVDALFVAALGSNPTHPNDPTPVATWKAGNTGSNGDCALPLVPDWNLAKLRVATTTIQVLNSTGPRLPSIDLVANTADLGLPQAPLGTYTFNIAAQNDPNEPRYDSHQSSYSADDRTAIAELIINDVRLSFFGSSPEYAGDFRAFDLNGDGKAHCSGFASVGGGPLGQYTTNVDAQGIARVPVDAYFSNTGCFFVGKSRFWRIMVRGELWDNVLRTAVSCAQLDSVLCVDPMNEAQEWVPGAVPDPAKGHYATHVIYQRWFYNTYRGLMPRER